MRLQTKIFILLSVVLGILLVSFLSYQFIQLHERKLIYRESQKSQEQIIDKVLQINRVKTEQLLNDNSGWDDMVEFVSKPDIEWAKDNVNFFINSFKLSFVLVYNKDKELIYQYGDSGCLKELKYPNKNLINNKLTSNPYTHYFQYCGNQLIELFGAIVVPSSDADTRSTPPQGYLFIGRIWDKAYLNDHSEATGYSVQILNQNDLKNFKKDPKRIYFIRDIDDHLGNSIGTLAFSKYDELQDNLQQLFNLSILTILLSAASFFVFLVYFRKIVLSPLKKVSKSLHTKDTEILTPLKSYNDEFRILANLICEFFEQQEVLKKNNLKLEEINATKDRLFSIIAHDLKNPVGSIVSMADLLSNLIKEKDWVTTEELIELLRQQSNETLDLLTSLFDWARSQSGQLVFSPIKQSLIDVVNDAVNNMQTTAILKNISINKQTNLDIDVFADYNMLKTILRNLISNAIKYTNNGGIILISAKELINETEISIIDSGIGMDEETKNKLFKIETHLSVRGTANEKGNGLGLLICKELIEKQGGTIRVESKLNSGSRFIFTLPNKSE